MCKLESDDVSAQGCNIAAPPPDMTTSLQETTEANTASGSEWVLPKVLERTEA